jgi:hypothetical protein
MAISHRLTTRALGAIIAGLMLTGAGLVGSAAPAAAAFKFRKIVDSNTPVPQGGGATFQVGIGTPPAVSGDYVVFLAGNEEYWTMTTRGRQKKRVITRDMRIPRGGGTTFHQGRGGTFVQIYGQTVVFAGIDCDFCIHSSGLYTVPVGGGTRKRIVDIHDRRPDDNTKNFHAFTDDFHVSGSRVVFSNGDSQIFAAPIAGGSSALVAGGVTCDEPYCLFGLPTLDSTESNVLVGAWGSGDNARIVRRKRNGALLEVVADKDTHPPNTPAAYRFDPLHTSFYLPVIDRTDTHRFSIFKGESAAPSSPRITGIYSKGTGGLVRLADTRMHVPGGTGKFTAAGFTGSGGRSLAAANGIVIFRGVDAANKLGIYAVRASGGPIIKVIAQGDPINGTTVDTNEPQSLVFQRDGFDGTTLVFFAQYALNSGRGLFSTQVVLP